MAADDQARDHQARDNRARDERILAVIRSLREGEVVTYGEIATDAGFPKMSRLVGRLLATHSTGGETDSETDSETDGADDELPWWRVVNAAGRLVPGNEREQIALLRSEGVRCADGRVREARFGRFSPRRQPDPDPTQRPSSDRRSRRPRSAP